MTMAWRPEQDRPSRSDMAPMLAAGWMAECEPETGGCGVTIILDGDSRGVPDPEGWEFSRGPCPVCGEPIYFDAMNETLEERDARMIRQGYDAGWQDGREMG
jgi:hypothetical protein